MDTQALVNALKSGHLAGAGERSVELPTYSALARSDTRSAVDVIENEPTRMDSGLSEELRSVPNLIVTPHTAWYRWDFCKQQRERGKAKAGVLGHGADMVFSFVNGFQ